MAFNIVLFEPEIPQNAGNIVRTCAATGSNLYMIKPLGFSVSDKYLKRAGLDYWNLVNIYYYNSLDELIDEKESQRFFFVTTKATQYYSDIAYEQGDFFVFGKETKGLPDDIHRKYESQRIKIPMVPNERARSLNLANAANIVLYEALRQNEFAGLT